MQHDAGDDGILEAIRAQLDREMIAEIHCQALINEGWFLVRYHYPLTQEEISSWIADHIRGEHFLLHTRCLFREESDATLFRMRWL